MRDLKMSDKIRVLLIEDNPGDARLIKELLSEAGDRQFELEWIDRLSPGLERLATGEFDALLLDLGLPGRPFHGLDTLREVLGKAPHVPIVVQTGFDDEKTGISAIKEGAQDYLVKGNLSSQLLTRSIHYSIERKRAETALQKAHDELELRVRERTAELVKINETLQQEIIERLSAEQASKRAEEELKQKADQLVSSKKEIENLYEESEKARKSLLSVLADVAEKEQSLRESEEKYRDIFDNAIDAIFLCAPDGKFLDGNPAVLSMFGFESKIELLEQNISHFYQNPAERDNCLKELLKKDYIKDQPVNLKRKDGEKIIGILSATTANVEGKIVAFRVTIHNVTSEKLLEQQLYQAQKMEALGILAGSIAHDFNNILTVIMGNAQIGAMMVSSDDKLFSYFKKIEDASNRAKALAKQITAFSRKDDLEFKAVDLNEVIQGFEPLLARLIGVNIRTGAHLWETNLMIKADPNSLEQALMNLAVNARDAMPDGGQILIQTQPYEIQPGHLFWKPDLNTYQYALLKVSDTGCGMPEEALKHIFEPFYTTKERGHGTGLGLSVVFGVVKQHNGFIDVKSQIGKGTSFEIYLPLSDTAVRFRETVAQPDTLRGYGAILIGEYDESILEMTRDFLVASGYKVITARDGQTLVDIYSGQKDKIDLVITDLAMPVMNGYEAYNKIVKINPQIKIIFMTGYSPDSLPEDISMLKGFPMISKPFTRIQLVNKVKEILKT